MGRKVLRKKKRRRRVDGIKRGKKARKANDEKKKTGVVINYGSEMERKKTFLSFFHFELRALSLSLSLSLSLFLSLSLSLSLSEPNFEKRA